MKLIGFIVSRFLKYFMGNITLKWNLWRPELVATALTHGCVYFV